MYKFLIFDADNTLFDFNKAEKNALFKVLYDIGIKPNEKMVSSYIAINNVLWKMYEKGETTQQKLKIERFRRLFNQIGSDADYLKASEDYLIYLSEGAFLLPDALDLITELKTGYVLGMLTNGISSVQHPRLARSPFHGIFDAVVVSGDIGISKPNPEIFRILAEKAGISNKKEMIIFGDSLSSDIKGGLNYGIDTCWFNPKFNKNKTDIVPKYEISSLKEIYRILEQGK